MIFIVLVHLLSALPNLTMKKGTSWGRLIENQVVKTSATIFSTFQMVLFVFPNDRRMLTSSGRPICIGVLTICLSLQSFWLKYLTLTVKAKIKESFDWSRISIRRYWGFMLQRRLMLAKDFLRRHWNYAWNLNNRQRNKILSKCFNFLEKIVRNNCLVVQITLQ